MPAYAAADELLTLLDSLALSSDAMFAIDDRHRIVFWNRPLQRLLGYEHDEVAGRACSSVLAGDDSFGNRYCAEACPVTMIARRGSPVRQFRLRVKAKDGAFVQLELSVLRFVMKSGHTVLAHVVRPAEEVAAAPVAHRSTSVDPRVRELTERETEILSLVAAGQKTGAIADRLCISRLTARNHVQHIFRKLEVHSKAEAVAFAYRAQIV